MTLSMVCALALPAHAAEKVYPDITGHYAADAIGVWSDYGVLEGYLDGSFRPEGKITRAEMATVLDRVMGYRNVAENTFTDLPDGQWYTGYLLRSAAEGIFKGNPDGTMKPNEPITRQEAFAALSRVLDMEESDKPTGFKDDAAIADWARGYVSAMKQAGYIEGDRQGNIRAGAPITRAEVVTILNRMARAFVNEDGTYSQDCRGNMIVNARDVTLKDMTIEGDLIVADGVGDGDVYLDKVTVKGNIVLRGCGENSFHILPGTSVKNIIVTKTTRGVIRLVNESGETIPMIYVNDGKAGVTLDGDNLGDVVIACDAPVTISAKSVKTVSVSKDAKVTVAKGATVAKVDLAKTAAKASLTVEGKVTRLTNDAKIKVEKANGGSVSSSSGGSSSGGSSSGGDSSSGGSSGGGGGSDTPAPSTPTTVSEVTLQLLAPGFGNIPDEADVLGVGYTAETEWKNADGSAPSYRWKAADSEEKDTFTTDQAYQAVVTLSPVSGYVFVDDLKVKVTDGNGNDFTPAKSEKSGNNWVVTMKYEATEHREPIELAGKAEPIEVVSGKTTTVSAMIWDNKLLDPSSYAYQWYKCDADGSNATALSGETKAAHQLSDSETRYTGSYYYRLKITIAQKEYQSAIIEVKVLPSIQRSDIPKPESDGVIKVSDDFRELQFGLNNLVVHKDVSYDYSHALTYKSVTCDGVEQIYTMKTGGGIYDIIDGHAVGKIPLPDYLSRLLEGEMKNADTKMIEPISIKWTVEPHIMIGNHRTPIEECFIEMSYDFTDDKLQYIFVREDDETTPEMTDRVTTGVQLQVGNIISDCIVAEARIVYQEAGEKKNFPETYECVKLGSSGTSEPYGEKYFLLEDLRWDGLYWSTDSFYMPEFEGKVDELWDVWLYGFAIHRNETEENYNRLYIYEIRPEIILDQGNQ